jgi:hypothetical protein
VGGTAKGTNQTSTSYVLLLVDMLTGLHFLVTGRSKNKGRQAVQAILLLNDAVEHQRKAVMKLEGRLAADTLDDVGGLSEQLQDARRHLVSLEQGLHRKKTMLGVNEQADLHRLHNDAFLRLRMNALALKQRLRDRLRQRKFEIERLERSYSHNANSMLTRNIIYNMLMRH